MTVHIVSRETKFKGDTDNNSPDWSATTSMSSNDTEPVIFLHQKPFRYLEILCPFNNEVN